MQGIKCRGYSGHFVTIQYIVVMMQNWNSVLCLCVAWHKTVGRSRKSSAEMRRKMKHRIVQVFYGSGKGKTSAAIGQAIRAASLGQKVTIIQFLKGKDAEEFCYLEKLEPDIRLFRFEKWEGRYDKLLESQKKEEIKNFLNAFNFAKKVIDTGECDVLILDEVLGLIDLDILSVEDIISLIDLREDYERLVLTGRMLPKTIAAHADVISKIDLEKDNY